MNRSQKTNGSAMITAVVLAAVLTILVAGYLSSISSQYTLDNRATQWQQALYLAEAGVELGLEQLNFHYATGNSPFSGWQSLAGGTAYSTNVTGLLDLNGDTVGNYSVIVTNVGGTSPIVYATGTAANPHGPSVSRMVWIVTSKNVYFPYGFLAKGAVSSSNPSFYIDSFNSSTAPGGHYPGGGPVNANAIIGTTGGTISWSGKIYGDATVSGAGTMSSLSGSVGNTTNTAQRATTITNAVSMGYLLTVPAPSSFPAPTAPFTGPPATSLGAVNLGSSTTTLASGDYYATSITGNAAGGKLNCTGNVRLYVSGNISLTQLCGIDVASGGSLQLYILGTITLNNAGYINSSSPAAQCIITGLGSGINWSLTCNGNFNAAVYAPNVNITVTGSGVITGAIYANSLTMSGAGAFHYDEALAGNNGGIPYSAQAWKEYRNNNGTWVVN